jgi:hypothetical protein
MGGHYCCFSADILNFSISLVMFRAWSYPVIVSSKFIYCLSCGFINLSTDKVTLSTAAFSHNKAVSLGTARGVGGVRTVVKEMYCTTILMWGTQNFLTLKRVMLEKVGNH